MRRRSRSLLCGLGCRRYRRGAGSRLRRHRCHLRRGGRRTLAQVGRVEQQRVVAHDASGRPLGFQDQVDEGIVDRPLARQLQEVAPVGAALQGDLDAGERRVVFQAGRAKCFGRGQGGAQRGSLVRIDLHDFDVGAKGLAQCGLDVDSTQCKGGGIRRPDAEEHGRGECQGVGAPVRLIHRYLRPHCSVCRQFFSLHANKRLDADVLKGP